MRLWLTTLSHLMHKHTHTHLANAALLCDDDVFIERHIERKEEERGMNKLTGTHDNAKRES